MLAPDRLTQVSGQVIIFTLRGVRQPLRCFQERNLVPPVPSQLVRVMITALLLARGVPIILWLERQIMPEVEAKQLPVLNVLHSRFETSVRQSGDTRWLRHAKVKHGCY